MGGKELFLFRNGSQIFGSTLVFSLEKLFFRPLSLVRRRRRREEGGGKKCSKRGRYKSCFEEEEEEGGV